MKNSRLMRLVLGATVITLVAAACQTVDSDPAPDPVTTTTERLEVLDVTVSTGPSVIPGDDSAPATGLRVARHATTTTSSTSTSTTSTTTTTVASKPLIPFPDIPPLTVFQAAEDDAVRVVSDPYMIDPENCEGILWATAGSDWSFFTVTAATADGFCEVWIGGQVDNPGYTGNPHLYCLVSGNHSPIAVASDANTDWVSEPGLCGPTGFDQG